MTNYSLVPNAQQQMGSWGQPNLNLMGQVPHPPMFDYSLGGQGMTPAMGMGGAQGLQLGGNNGYAGMSNWGVGSAGNSLGSGFGMNMPTFALGLQGLNSLGSLYMGAKSLDLANRQFSSAKNIADTNMRNQTQSYNDTLENKLRRIGSFNETSKEETEAEIARRKLPAYNG